MKGDKMKVKYLLNDTTSVNPIKINQTSKSKPNLPKNEKKLSINTNSTVTQQKMDNTMKKLHPETIKKNKGLNFIGSGELSKQVYKDNDSNNRIMDTLNKRFSKKASPGKNTKSNDSQLKSCLENYVKNSRKMRNLSESQNFFKSFSKILTKGNLIHNSPSNLLQYTSFNEVYRKKHVSTKNSEISSLSNSTNEKIKKEFNSKKEFKKSENIKSKTNSVNPGLRQDSNNEMKRNLSLLCENSNKLVFSDIKSINSNLITKSNSKPKFYTDSITSNTTNNFIASPKDEKNGNMSSPILIDSTRNKINLLKSILMDLLKKKGSNKNLANEIDMIYKSIISTNFNQSINSSPNFINEEEILDFNQVETLRNKDYLTNIKSENDFLKKENFELKSKIDLIDKKFDKILKENESIKNYFMLKSDKIESMESHLINIEKALKETKINPLDKKLCVNNNKSAKILKPKLNNKNSSNKFNSKNAYVKPSSNNNLINSVNYQSTSKGSFCCNLVSPQVKESKNRVTRKSPLKQSNLKLKYNELKKTDEINDLESLNYSQYAIENPKEIFYLPQKVAKQYNKIPKYIPKLNIQKTDNRRTKSEFQFQIELLNISQEDPKTPSTLNGFIDNDKIESEKNINIDNLNIGDGNEVEVNQDNKNKSISINSTNPSSKQNFILNLENLPKADYHKEFIAKYNDFSPSWRKECKKMKGFIADEN